MRVWDVFVRDFVVVHFVYDLFVDFLESLRLSGKRWRECWTRPLDGLHGP